MKIAALVSMFVSIFAPFVPASADTIHYECSGLVIRSGSLTNNPFSEGQTYTLSVLIDTATPDTNPQPAFGFYEGADFFFDIGGGIYSNSGTARVQVGSASFGIVSDQFVDTPVSGQDPVFFLLMQWHDIGGVGSGSVDLLSTLDLIEIGVSGGWTLDFEAGFVTGDLTECRGVVVETPIAEVLAFGPVGKALLVILLGAAGAVLVSRRTVM